MLDIKDRKSTSTISGQNEDYLADNQSEIGYSNPENLTIYENRGETPAPEGPGPCEGGDNCNAHDDSLGRNPNKE